MCYVLTLGLQEADFKDGYRCASAVSQVPKAERTKRHVGRAAFRTRPDPGTSDVQAKHLAVGVLSTHRHVPLKGLRSLFDGTWDLLKGI